MFSQVFLAATPRELEIFRPERAAYMACHFSAGGKGLSNLPGELPPGSILLLDDSMPVDGHCAETVAKELTELIKKHQIQAVLLDFQRQICGKSHQMVSEICRALPCPVAAPPGYAPKGAPVFLPPPPVNKPLAAYLQPWRKRGIYLEIAPQTTRFTITKEGCRVYPMPWAPFLPLQEPGLHCHYREAREAETVVFTLTRTLEDLDALSREGYALGITAAIGLYWELTGGK